MIVHTLSIVLYGAELVGNISKVSVGNLTNFFNVASAVLFVLNSITFAYIICYNWQVYCNLITLFHEYLSVKNGKSSSLGLIQLTKMKVITQFSKSFSKPPAVT